MKILINVCGLPRSGTSALDLMLGSGPGAFSCGEVGDWYRLVRHRRGREPRPSWAPLLAVPPSRFHRHAMEHLGVDVLVDSSKDKCWLFDVQRWARAADLRVANVLIWKTPEALALSYWKRGDLDTWYRQYVRYHAFMDAAGIGYVTVPHEALSADPAAVLARLCAYLGVPYFQGKERFWEHPHDHLGGSPGVRRQVRSGAERASGDAPPEAFAPVAARVREQVETDARLAAIVARLEAADFRRAPALGPDGHAFDPSLPTVLEHEARCRAKSAWLRVRWNLVEPYVIAPRRRRRREAET